jgi:hypothetical protein
VVKRKISSPSRESNPGTLIQSSLVVNTVSNSMDVEWMSSFPVTCVCRDVLPALINVFVLYYRFLFFSQSCHCAAL